MGPHILGISGFGKERVEPGRLCKIPERARLFVLLEKPGDKGEWGRRGGSFAWQRERGSLSHRRSRGWHHPHFYLRFGIMLNRRPFPVLSSSRQAVHASLDRIDEIEG